MAFYIFDACALIALTEKEEGSEFLENILASEENTCFVHSLNLCEVYYQAHRNSSADDASALIEGLLELGFIERADIDMEFWNAAGALKSVHRRVSLADCFGIALALRLDAPLVTSDHHEFDVLALANVCKIEFFR